MQIDIMEDHHKKRGFTLIELVMVMVIMGILAIVALPKLGNLTGQARKSAANAVAGGLMAAVSVAHAEWLANGGLGAASVTLEGSQVIYVNSFGWPEDTAAMATGTVNANKCLNLWNGLFNNPPLASNSVTQCAATSGCVYVAGISGTTTCTYTDGQGTGANVVTYNVTTGAVVAPL